MPIFFFSHLYQWLWGEPSPKPPKWIPSLRSWGEGIWTWVVFLMGICVGISVIFGRYEARLPRYIRDNDGTILVIVFFVFSAHLYHLRYVIQERIFKSSKGNN